MSNTDSQELHQVDNDPGYLVVRNEFHTEQNATVSFGPDWQAHKYAKVLDVVNYYKPNPKNQLYLPENSFFNSNGKIRAHMGGETTFRADSSNANKNTSTHTNNYTFENQFGELDSVDSDNDTVVPEARQRGLFEVPFDVCSMPRLIAPFKGFSKIVTSRAVKLLTFTETEDEDLVCKVDKGGLRTLQKQVGDLNVVSVSFTGDPKSGKSFLACLLVGKENVSFNVSESYINPNNMLTHGTVWMYVAVYLEKHAYVFLDFEGFEHSEKYKTKMLLFAFAASSLVFCNVKYSLMNGIHNSVTAMVQLTKKPSVNAPLNEEEMLDEENEFLEILKDRGTRLMSNTYETQNFNELNQESEQESANQLEQRELWNAPIVQFVFRDCSGFVKCIDDRIFTPETLVEQGLFENYLDLFTTVERDPHFKNEMLDSFEVFTNRKYLSLPHPTLSTHPYSDNDYSDREGLNLTEFFVKLLSSDKNDFRKLTRFGHDEFNLNSNLSSLFYEKLDQLKSLVYHDTLNYAMAHSKLNGRMFGEYLKKLSYEFNKNNNLSVNKLNETLSDVFLGENNNVLKESLLQFLRQIRAKVAPRLPLDSKTLLNLVYSAKFTSTNFFESKAFGTPGEYRHQLDELSDTLDELMRKLEDKNKALMTTQIANYVEIKEANIRANILRSGYEVNDLNNDLSKLKKSLNSKFSEADLVMKVLARASQNLVRLFNDTHPETFVHNLNYSKSTSIEETFENLNSEITSMTSNLYLNSQLKNPQAYPGADDSMSDYGKTKKDSNDENDKLNSDLEDNTLDYEEEELVESECEEKEETEELEETQDGSESAGDRLNTLEVEKELNDNLEDYAEEIDENDDDENKEYKYNKENASEQWVFGESGGTRSFREDTTKYTNQNSNVVYDQGRTSETKDDEVVQVLEDDFAQEEFDDFNNTTQVANNNVSESANNTQETESLSGGEDVESNENNEDEETEESSEQNETEELEESELAAGEDEEREESTSTSSADESMETNEEITDELETEEVTEETSEESSESSAEVTEETYEEDTSVVDDEENDNKEYRDNRYDRKEQEIDEVEETDEVDDVVEQQEVELENDKEEDNLEERDNDKNNNTNEQNSDKYYKSNSQNDKYNTYNKNKYKKFKKHKHSHRGAVLKEIFDKAADSLRLHKSPKNVS